MRNNADEIREKLYKDPEGIYRLKDTSGIDAGGPPPGMQTGATPGGQAGIPPTGQGSAAGSQTGGMQGGQVQGQVAAPAAKAAGAQSGQASASSGQASDSSCGEVDASAASKSSKIRSSFQNTIGAQYATRVVTNWMGDDGWLYRFAWRLAFSLDAGQNQFPEDFDRPSYLYKVPYLKYQGKLMLTHGFEGDLAITKAYVCDKYIKAGKHYVDLVVWLETIDGLVWSECYAVVELPSKEDKK
jgi:hypothetical protein